MDGSCILIHTHAHIRARSGVARGGPGGPWPPQTFGKCFFLERIDVVTWFECVSRPGKCA